MRSFLQDVFQTRYREATASAILFAIVIGLVMNAAITYAGLKIGFTMGGSAIAAVLGFGVLRGVLRRGSILETNMAQTCASAVNTPNACIIFTVPVLFLLGLPLATDSADFWLITLAAVGGAILGTAFIIPLRKQMIEIDRLRFPTGMGVAAILKSPGAGPRKALVLLGGVVAGAAVYWFVAAEQLGLPSYGSLGIGTMERCLELGAAYARQRVTFGQPLAERQAGEAPILQEDSERVRLMPVHRAKVLEFPAVIRGDPPAGRRVRAGGAPVAGVGVRAWASRGA